MVKPQKPHPQKPQKPQKPQWKTKQKTNKKIALLYMFVRVVFAISLPWHIAMSNSS
jgi:hypothetical protein